MFCNAPATRHGQRGRRADFRPATNVHLQRSAMRGSSSKHSAEAADLRGARPTAFRLKIQLGKEADDVASVVPNVCEEGSDSVGVGVDGIDSVDVRWIFHSHDKPYAGVSRFQSIGSTPMP